VLDIINKDMLLVEAGGVSFPVYKDQVDFPYFRRFTEKKKESAKPRLYAEDLKKEKKTPQPRKEDGVWLTFLPVMDTDEFGDTVVEELKLHLVNHTAAAYEFTYRLLFFGKPDFELRNTVLPFSDFYLHDIPFEDLNDSPAFSFEFVRQPPDRQKVPFLESAVRLKPKQLFARIDELQRENKATFSEKLFDQYPDKPVEDRVEMGPLASRGYRVYEAGKARQHLESPRSVVDLHIDKITDDWKGLSNYEILSLQLRNFEKFLELSILHHQPTLIVIHGVGEGVLRDEIHSLLRLRREVKSFVNQYHPAYGFGATEIYFQY
jgi:hypothetical protein